MMRELDRMSSRWLYILAVVVFPLLSILFFGSLFREGVPSDMPIAVVDLDQTATSRKIVRNIDITQLSKVAMILPTTALRRHTALRTIPSTVATFTMW